jgi:hypothetical protein
MIVLLTDNNTKEGQPLMASGLGAEILCDLDECNLVARMSDLTVNVGVDLFWRRKTLHFDWKHWTLIEGRELANMSFESPLRSWVDGQ